VRRRDRPSVGPRDLGAAGGRPAPGGRRREPQVSLEGHQASGRIRADSPQAARRAPRRGRRPELAADQRTRRRGPRRGSRHHHRRSSGERATRRTLEEIAADRSHVWHSNRAQIDLSDVAGAKRAPLPAKVVPPKAAARKAPPAGDDWLHEMAIPGERLLARTENGEVRLFGPTGAALATAAARKRQAVADAVRLVPSATLLVDGVLTAVAPDGHADPQALARTLDGEGPATLTYYLFDLAYLDGHDLRAVPLGRRKELLADLLRKVAERTCLRYLDHVVGGGADFQQAARALGIPAMLSRRADSRYDGRAGWLTIPCDTR